MAKKAVVWSETAVRQRREILHYWNVRNGSTRYSEKLVGLIAKRIKVIQNDPEAYRRTDHPDTRISAMGHFSIIYKLLEDRIVIVAFWDNRQDPKKLIKIIKRS